MNNNETSITIPKNTTIIVIPQNNPTEEKIAGIISIGIIFVFVVICCIVNPVKKKNGQ
jgi:hypothetical protein